MTANTGILPQSASEVANPFYDMYVSEGGVSETRLLAQLEEYGIPERECAYIRATRRAVTDMVEYLREKKCPVQKMNLNFKDRESKQAVRAKLEAMPEVLVTSSLPWNLELNAAGITKGSGMRNLCQYLGIEAEETMAFGDGENDWPMLEAAGIGVAMENGAPFLKERADRIAASNREDGVAEAIRQWVLI